MFYLLPAAGTGKNSVPETMTHATLVVMLSCKDKNLSGDEIANVNFYAVRSGSYQNSLK